RRRTSTRTRTRSRLCLREERSVRYIPLIEGVAGAAEDVADFVADQFFDFGTGRAEIFAGVEFFGVLGKDPPNRGGHGEAEVGVNVDLGAADPTGGFDVGLRDAGGF